MVCSSTPVIFHTSNIRFTNINNWYSIFNDENRLNIIIMVKLRKLIENTVEQHLNESYNIKNIILYYKDNTFLLYHNDTPIGVITYYYDVEVDVYCVSGSYVTDEYQGKGYGTFLYESVLTKVYPKGCTMSRESNTSDSAIAVWEKMSNRKDVKKERINYKGMTHKREDLPNGFMSDNKEWIKKVLTIEDTRFFYNYGKSKLDSYMCEPLEDFDVISMDMLDNM